MSRISRPGSLYDASKSEQTPDGVGRGLGNLIDFDEVLEAHVTKATENPKFPTLKDLVGFFGEAVGRCEQCYFAKPPLKRLMPRKLISKRKTYFNCKMP